MSTLLLGVNRLRDASFSILDVVHNHFFARISGIKIIDSRFSSSEYIATISSSVDARADTPWTSAEVSLRYQ